MSSVALPSKSAVDAHTCLSLAVPIDGSAGQQSIVDECSVPLVNPELIGIAIVRDINVYPTIIIEIRSHYSQSMQLKEIVDDRADWLIKQLKLGTP